MWMLETIPSGQVGKRAKVGLRFSGYRDTGFNFDSHIVAIAEKTVLYILDCVG